MPYRSLRAAVRCCISTTVGNSLKDCLAASVQVLECFVFVMRFSVPDQKCSNSSFTAFKEFPTGIEILERSSSIS